MNETHSADYWANAFKATDNPLNLLLAVLAGAKANIELIVGAAYTPEYVAKPLHEQGLSFAASCGGLAKYLSETLDPKHRILIGKLLVVSDNDELADGMVRHVFPPKTNVSTPGVTVHVDADGTTTIKVSK